MSAPALCSTEIDRATALLRELAALRELLPLRALLPLVGHADALAALAVAWGGSGDGPDVGLAVVGAGTLPSGEPVPWLPARATDGSDAFDLRVNLATVREPVGVTTAGEAPGAPGTPATLTLAPGGRVTLGLGVAVTAAWPPGLTCHLYARSGAGRDSISLRNAVGIIDRDFLGREALCMLRNDGDQPYVVQHGQRVIQAQYLLVAFPRHTAADAAAAAAVVPGRAGFHSTGVL